MTGKPKINFSLLMVISFYLHFVIVVAVILPNPEEAFRFIEKIKNSMFASHRTFEFITNINADNKIKFTEKTFISDRTSTEKGFLTKRKGDDWISDTKYFKYSRGKGKSDGKGKKISLKNSKETFILNDNSEVIIQLDKGDISSNDSKFGRIKIPRTDLITRENAIFYSNTGAFSFNTIKALTKEELEWMRHWGRAFGANFFPPLLANIALGGYAPGRVRIMAIPDQIVKGFHILDKNGKIVYSKILDSRGDQSLNAAIKEALHSAPFGKVPPRFLNEKGYYGAPFIIYYIYR